MRLQSLFSTGVAALLVAGMSAFSSADRFHAHLVRAEPAVNDTIATTPKSVRLWFSEPLELALSRVRIVRIGGDTVNTGVLRHDGSAVTTATLDLGVRVTAPGTYVVTYRVVARDGHPTAGSYNFVVRESGAK